MMLWFTYDSSSNINHVTCTNGTHSSIHSISSDEIKYIPTITTIPNIQKLIGEPQIPKGFNDKNV